MLVQVRENETWLIRQHDHALLAGELAMRWGAAKFGPPQPRHLVVLAVMMHDIGWQEVDEYPLLNPQTGVPHSVFDYPMAPRAGFFSRGVDRSEQIHPYVALLDSLHYTSFPFMSDNTELQSSEARRQARVLAQLGPGKAEIGGDGSSVLDQLEFLRMMDRLSLHICNMLPGSCRLNIPPYEDSDDIWANWNGGLEEQLFTRAPRTPQLGPLDLRWEGDGKLVIDPFPFSGTFTATVPFRRLIGTRFASETELRSAWVESEQSEFTVELADAAGGDNR